MKKFQNFLAETENDLKDEKKENVLRDLKVWKKEGLNNIDKCYSILEEKTVKYSNVIKITVKI